MSALFVEMRVGSPLVRSSNQLPSPELPTDAHYSIISGVSTSTRTMLIYHRSIPPSRAFDSLKLDPSLFSADLVHIGLSMVLCFTSASLPSYGVIMRLIGLNRVPNLNATEALVWFAGMNGTSRLNSHHHFAGLRCRDRVIRRVALPNEVDVWCM